MIIRNHRLYAAAVLAPCLLCISASFGQTAASAPTVVPVSAPAKAAAPADEEIVELNPFLVTTTATGRYQVNDSASGSRISQNIMDSSSTMATLTRDMINDLGAGQTLKAARYIAGITDSTIPDALDRITIRGFQTDGQRIDGFTYEGQAAYDQATVDRIEVIKGPNALLLPSGTPGGTINQVSKSPLFKEQGYVTVQLGQYDANRVEADVTGPLNKNLAYRMVTAYQDSRGYQERSYRDSLIVSPSFTYKFSPTAQLTVHAEYYNFRVSSSGTPLDATTVGTTTAYHPYPGMPDDYSFAMRGDFRKERREATWFLFTGKITDNLSVRLAGRASQVSGPVMSFGFAPYSANNKAAPQGSYDPATGNWIPGVIYGGASTNYAPTAAADIAYWKHTGSYQTNIYRREDLQNDYVYQYDLPYAKTTTLAGFAYGYFSNNRVNTNATMPNVVNPFDLASWFNDPITWDSFSGTDQQLRYNSMQKYITESVSLWDDRIVLNGGVANFSFSGYITNKYLKADGTPTVPISSGFGDANTVNYGIVVKPIKNVSIYYGHTENSSPTTSFNTVSAVGSTVPKFSIGKDDEEGIKLQLFGDRLFLMVDHYDIVQTAYGIGDPRNNVIPAPVTQYPTMYSTRHAKGWEYQITGSLTKQLSVSANYTNFKNRDPNGIPFRTTAEQSGGIYVHYEFTDGMLKGFAAGVGVNYMSKAPGDSVSGYTTYTVPVPNQPTFYYPAHTVTDLNLSYTRGREVYRLNVYNLTDEVYYNGGGSRTGNNMATPRNVTGSVTYKF